MPKIEVEEEEFLSNQKLRKTVSEMLKRPDARKLLLQAEKLVDPDRSIPEIDQEKIVEEKVGALAKTVTDFIAESKTQREKDAEDRKLEKLRESMESGISRYRETEGLTDDGEAKLREIMVKDGIVNVDDAWAVLQRRHPPPPPAAPASGRMFDVISAAKSGDDEFMKAMIESRGENQQIVDKVAWDAINEVRGAKAR